MRGRLNGSEEIETKKRKTKWIGLVDGIQSNPVHFIPFYSRKVDWGGQITTFIFMV